MSGQSNVGNSQVYQADDQRTVPDSQIEEEKKENRFQEGKDNSHLANDPSKSIEFPRLALYLLHDLVVLQCTSGHLAIQSCR